MASQSVQPLRIQKSAAPSSPSKMNRTLVELSPMGIRRNSPSFPQHNKNNTYKGDSSPYDSSPFATNSASSPRLFWQGREPISPNRGNLENRSPFDHEQSPGPSKRSSIENLKKASRVKNSSMFAREHKNEYDPAQVTVPDRPLATGRPLNTQVQGNSFAGQGLGGMRMENVRPLMEEPTKQAATEPIEELSPPVAVAPFFPSKFSSSPAKSSLSKKTAMNARDMGFDPANAIWSDEEDSATERTLPEGRVLHRHAKSVTFDKAPPQINEYEMTTPDPSSVASGSRESSYDSAEEEMDEDGSFERGYSLEREDSFDASLEDTDKTPVVLPEDWRFMSPDVANTDLVRDEDDTFDGEYGSPEPTAHPGQMDLRPHQTSVNSVDSNGQPRPLPPLPNMMAPNSSRPLSGTLERISSGQRSLPSPPQAAGISKSDIRRMSGTGLSLEDRLRLMMLQDRGIENVKAQYHQAQVSSRDEPEQCRPVHDHVSQAVEADHGVDTSRSTKGLEEETHISRESILRRLSSQKSLREGDMDERIPPASMNVLSYLTADPDVPIPSMEDPTRHKAEEAADEQEVLIKEEPNEESDLYSVPDMYSGQSLAQSDAGDTESLYSQASGPVFAGSYHDDDRATPRAQSPIGETNGVAAPETERMSLPELTDFGNANGFDFGLGSYMTPSPPIDKTASETMQESTPPSFQEESDRPMTPEEQLQPPSLFHFGDETGTEPSTPDSVIHHPIEESQVPEVTAPVATFKAPGAELKTKPSITPADATTMAATRRQVSGQSVAPQAQDASSTPAGEGEPEPTPGAIVSPGESSKRVSSLVQLEIPRDQSEDSLGFGLEKEFDRVLEAQKRGYLMRQNTKVVVASNRADQETKAPEAADAKPVDPTPRKASQQTWVTEPWNGKSRRRSIRAAGETSPRKRAPSVPVPPLPGQPSNVQETLGAVHEDGITEEEPQDFDENAERGRLFVKVIGAKDLDLPLSRDEQSHFALTLDNGLHCVTTSWLQLGKSAPIGQEFELVVLNELEFQLTLQMKLEQRQPAPVESPVKTPPSPTKKQSAFSRLFGSPKKNREAEISRPNSPVKVQPPSTYDMVQGVVGKDGSFGRAYVALSEHEKHAFGRPYTVDITCFNEWAMEEVTVGSSRSKKSVTAMQRRPPYQVGKLELQLLYIPKPKGARDEDMPKSMNSAVRELREAEARTSHAFEGHLSQQGGDCPYWRRRLFKLAGAKLTAYHETTHQPRATINLAKASKLIDDKSALTKKETSTKGGGRRKSAFAEEEEGYMFVEEGFRIRFANGEVIDFYADSAAEKGEWMKVLSEVVGKGGSSSQPKPWVDMILKRNNSLAAGKSRRGPGPVRPNISPRKSSKEQMQQQMALRAAAKQRTTMAAEEEAAAAAKAEAVAAVAAATERSPFKGRSSIPILSGSQPSPDKAPRYSQGLPPRPGAGHQRTESHQPVSSSSRSQPASPVKGKVSKEARHQKARSIIGMQWH